LLLGVDPDDAFSIIPYEKGCLFLYYLEILVGGKDHFLAWLNAFYSAHLRATITAERMRDHFLHYFSSRLSPEKLSCIDWDTWFHAPGLPAFDPTPSLINSFSIAAESVIKKWITSADGTDLRFADIENLKPSQVMFCLDELVISSSMPLNHKVLEKMEENYHLFKKNVEISNRFVGIGLKSKYAPAVPVCKQILAEHGRGRYVKYLYNCLNEYDHDEAVRTFQENKFRYHSVIVNAFKDKLAK